MITLTPFTPSDFETLISWVDTKELLVTIAGSVLSYPLTRDQLTKYLADPNSHPFNVVLAASGLTIGHAEIIVTGPGTFKLDKILIGNRAMRGKGLGEKVMEELLQYSFERMGAKEVELNVYDWNTGARRCYEKVGFAVNPDKLQVTEFDGYRWTALNMAIDEKTWENLKA